MPTKIEWCDETFNLRWGCTEVSAGCTNCYARTWDKRLGRADWGDSADRREFGPKHWEAPCAWNRRAEREGRKLLVFCASMADVMELPPRLELADAYARQLDALGDLINETPNLIWLLLTKRPQNWQWAYKAMGFYTETGRSKQFQAPPNVFPMTTVEDQQRANERIPKLFEIPSKLGHGISAEPLLGPLNLDRIDVTSHTESKTPTYLNALNGEWDGRQTPYKLGWIVPGGESGHNARPHNPAWFYQLRNDAANNNVPFLFKQHGEWLGIRDASIQQWNDGKRFALVDWDGQASFSEDGGSTAHLDGNEDAGALVWAGKKSAGRSLDGVEHSEFPAAFGQRP